MSKLTVESYEQLVRRSGLVDQAQLNKVLDELKLKYDDRNYDSEILAERLIEARLITLWQHQMIVEGRQDSLLGGRHRGFFLGSYKLLSLLGAGGMNSVYLAEHTVMRRMVAIKVLPVSGEEDPGFLDRFRMESRAIAALDHPNIVRAHDFNCDADVYYLVMEYVEGKDLHHLVSEKGPLPYSTAADFIRQAAEGLAHAHRAGLVHRDIKPANLLVDRKRVVRILDLGVARIDSEDDHEASITRGHSQSILGTADYLAPEQALDSHNVDSRADIYSMGCTLYFLLTGHPPFPKGTLAQRMLAHQMQEPASIYEDRPNAPQQLVQITQKMMAKKPEDRYRSAEEISQELGQWLQSLSQLAEDEKQAIGVRGVAASDTFPGLGASTTMGSKNKKKVQTVQVPGDERVMCRTCGTEFGRYMYRSKCPKCGTVNHPMAGLGSPYGGVQFAQSPTTCEEAKPETPPELHIPAAVLNDTNVKAWCPSCHTTFTARWSKCLVCSVATILRENMVAPAPPPNFSSAGAPPPLPDAGDFEAPSAPNVHGLADQAAMATSVAQAHLDTVKQSSGLNKLASTATATDTSPSRLSISTGSIPRMRPIVVKQPLLKVWHWVAIAACVVGIFGWGAWVIAGPARPVEFHANGKKKLEGRLLAGQRTGTWTSWFANGQRQWDGFYENNIQDGPWTFWDEQGQRLSSGAYRNGKQQGKWTFHFPDGQICKEGSYQGGLEDGTWTFWHPNGIRKATGEFKQGVRTGTWREWDEQGRPLTAAPLARDSAN